MSETEKKKQPVLDQAQAMSVPIPGALQPPAPMLVDVPVELPASTDPAAPAAAAPPAPMLVDVPVELPEITPDAEPDNGRPASEAHKDVWVAWAIEHGVPSYEAWALTVPELKKLEV